MEEGKPLIFLEPLTDSVKKLKEAIEETAEQDGIEIYEVDTIEEYNQLVPTIGQSLTIACQPKKCASAIQPLRRFIFKNNVKVLLINNKNIPPKTLEKFRKIGLTEYIQEPVPPKTLLYKINLFLRSLKKEEEIKEMSFKTSEEKEDIDNEYSDKKESQRHTKAGYMEGKGLEDKNFKDGKDSFSNNKKFGDDYEETQEDQFKDIIEKSAKQAIDARTGGLLKGQIAKEEEKKNAQEELFGDESDIYAGALKGDISPTLDDIQDDDEFDEDLFKSLDSVRKSNHKESDLGGNLQGNIAPTLDDTEEENGFDEDLFKSLDNISKSKQSQDDLGGKLQGEVTPTLDDVEDEKDTDEDLFKSLESVKRSGSKESDLGGYLEGEISPKLDGIRDDKDDDEDLLKSLESVKKKKHTREGDLGGYLEGEITPTLDDVENEKEKEEDLFKTLDNVKNTSKHQESNKEGLKGKLNSNTKSSDNPRNKDNDEFDLDLLNEIDKIKDDLPTSNAKDSDELINNKKGLTRELQDPSGTKRTMAPQEGRSHKKRPKDNELLDALDKHRSEKPKKYEDVHNLDLDNAQAPEKKEDLRKGGSIQYEKKGDLGEQTIDYKNLDKQPTIDREGEKASLDIKIADPYEAESVKDQSSSYDGKRQGKTSNEEEYERIAQDEAERIADEEEIEEAINSIFLPEPKDMDFLINAMNLTIDGDNLKNYTSDYINGFCRGEIIIYNIQNECIMGSEDVDERFNDIKVILKSKREPSWNDGTFQSELLYYHIPVIENGNYHNFIVFMTTKDEVARTDDTPKRVEQCLQVIKGSYLSGEDRESTTVESNKTSNSKIGGLFKGLFGGRA